jgi:hypothetical protein
VLDNIKWPELTKPASGALPLDLRKGSAFPGATAKTLEAAPRETALRHSLKPGKSHAGKAKPFRTSGGKVTD